MKKPVNEIDYQIEQQTVICEEELFDETALEEEKKEQIVDSQPVFQKSSRQNLVVQENQQQT